MAGKNAIKRGPKGPGRLSAAQAADLSDRLLDAAFDLFSNVGYANTTMEGIARKAGASTKTVYSRYANKGDVLQAVVRRIIDHTIMAAHKSEMGAEPKDVEPRVFLTSLGRQISITVSETAAGMGRLAFAEARRHPELARFYISAMAHGTGLIRGVLEQWRKDGLLPLMNDSEIAAILCLSIISDRARIRSVLGVPMSREEIDAYVAAGVDLFLRGCGYQPKAR